MVNRVQSLRSSTAGVRPTGQPAGVLYTNYADNAFGVVNAAGTAFDLLQVRLFSSLTTYVVGDFVKQAGNLYRAIANNGPGAFNGANWSQIQTAADATYLPLAGGTMLGPLVLSGEPSAALGAATKQTVDSKAPIASPTFTGVPAAPTVAPGTNTTQLATTAFVAASLAPLASPILTGNPTAPTPAPGDNDTSIATTAFVTTATGNSGVVVSDIAPVAPPAGKLWFDSVSAQLYVSYNDGSSQQWVVAVNNPTDLSAYLTTTAAAATYLTQANAAATYVAKAGSTMTGSLIMVNPASVLSGGYAKYTFYDTPAGTLKAQIYFDASNNSLHFNDVATGGDLSLSSAGLTANQQITGADIVMAKGVATATPGFAVANSAGTIINQVYGDVNNNWAHFTNAASGADMYFDTGVNMVYNGQAYKPGGGAWIATSDIRIKNVIGDYKPGLAEVIQLDPIIYTYKGNDTPSAEAVSVHRMVADAATPFVGLIAQEVEKVFPGMVSERAGFIDGKAAQIKDIDTGPLIYALVNAVKELKAEIEALKAGAR